MEGPGATVQRVDDDDDDEVGDEVGDGVLDRLVEMRVSVEDYSPFLSELSMFRVYLHATVDETSQLTATFTDFRLILPQLDIIVCQSITHYSLLTCSLY